VVLDPNALTGKAAQGKSPDACSTPESRAASDNQADAQGNGGQGATAKSSREEQENEERYAEGAQGGRVEIGVQTDEGVAADTHTPGESISHGDEGLTAAAHTPDEGIVHGDQGVTPASHTPAKNIGHGEEMTEVSEETEAEAQRDLALLAQTLTGMLHADVYVYVECHRVDVAS
jgi:hypothetical protein